jgi:hypothetical protein
MVGDSEYPLLAGRLMDRNHNFEAADMRWFRVYTDINSNPKILQLSDSMVGSWIKILAAAAEHKGNINSTIGLSVVIRKSVHTTEKILKTLISAGLIDETENRLVVHGWDKRQFKSDTSSNRVMAFRKRFSNVTETDATDNKNYPSKEGSSYSLTGFAFEAAPVKLTEQQTFAWQQEFHNLDLRQELELAATSLPLTANGWYHQLREFLKQRQRAVVAAKKTLPRVPSTPKALPPPKKKHIPSYKV